MTAAGVALSLVILAGAVILIGIILFVIGLIWESRHRKKTGLVKTQTFPQLLNELIKKLFTIIIGRAAPWKKLQAFGMLLILLGFAFLLASGVSALWGILGTGGPGHTTPPTDATPSPSST